VIRRIATPLVVIVTVAGLACIDMSAPKGPASISNLLLPSPSVVVGDTMRDSTGKAAPLRVIAYDANEVPLADQPTQFFIIDTGSTAHLAASSIVIGDKQGVVHLIGQVGGVQTTPVTIPVTVAPTTFSATGTVPDTFVVPFAGDTTSASTGSTTINATLKGRGDTAALGFIVKYELRNAPATVAGSAVPAVYIGDNTGKAATSDTTDASGVSRTLFVRSWLLADAALKAGQRVDSAVVVMSTSYKGTPVLGSPKRIVLPIKVRLVIP
jgi:hypothetical protein